MRRALVFSGQGSHRQGMSMEYLRVPAVARLWERMKCRMEQNYGISLQEVITENPQKIHVLEDALDINTLCQRSCLEDRNVAESFPRRKVVSCSQGGVMLRTFLTQPCMVAAQMMALEYLRATRGYSVEASSVIAGHSLGEFSALCALGVFSPEVAVDLVYKRGVFMEYALDQFSANRDNYVIYACNPVRAKLCEDDPDVAVDQFHVLVELVARALSTTTSFVEVVNYNIDHEQYVVAGDRVGMSALGKCLDPQFRASVCGPSSPLDHIARTAVSSVWQDKKDGVTMDPNKGLSPDFVTSSVKKYGVRSTYRRFMRGPDDGYTPSLEELTHLTLQEDGRSGLKKKSWFIPIPVNIPFHSSRLRRAMDLFLPVVRDAMPEEDVLRSLLGLAPKCVTESHSSSSSSTGERRPVWLTNLTGTAFRPMDAEFQGHALELLGSMNVGEIRHHGRYQTDMVEKAFKNGVERNSVREMCAAVLAAQMAHPVQWIDLMDATVIDEGVREVHEIAPVRTIADMFKRTIFREPGQGGAALDVVACCLPS
ncbi:acyl transferase-like protein [Trypanosoma rangeli]|uniref:[acyl-carrier-protein] S-malonyltransferase n=1 Tax=Trypanosoma rangeli TaxID=5698 RepID=A0A422NRA5_TRYRA|nr:acyl transferase-like protein [Trypanosoma rangeli]RNF07919.1 acyl transferase-like protein [Trypanosoma rangeli]|eukprot:RNF07919.1 acyl transferase-like protein [Trypanosoma rangeli]